MSFLKRMTLGALFAALLTAPPSQALCGSVAFGKDSVPKELADSAMRVTQGETVITIAFVGDCTLGGETDAKTGRRGFVRTVQREGMAYPFANIKPLLEKGDIAVCNLEGVLSGDASGKVRKEFNFIGSPDYAEILTLGGIGMVSLANNHALDFGARGKADTISALRAADIAYFDDDTVAVFEKDGVRVGFMGSVFGVNKKNAALQYAALKEAGCAAVVHSLHMGTEYAKNPTGSQRSTARYLAGMGVSLIVGHHPHVVQGAEIINGTPVLYSLGNCCFGGNTGPKDMDALLLIAELAFSDGRHVSTRLTFHPISISGLDSRNDYQPRPLYGDDAARVMEKLRRSSKTELAPYVDGEGAVQPLLDAPGQE